MKLCLIYLPLHSEGNCRHAFVFQYYQISLVNRLFMAFQVQLLYHDPSLGRQVNFVLKRLEILHVDPPLLQRPHDIDRFLSSFCTWQRDENPPGDSDPLHWDHALILTGLDLYVVSKNGKVSSQVVGTYRHQGS